MRTNFQWSRSRSWKKSRWKQRWNLHRWKNRSPIRFSRLEAKNPTFSSRRLSPCVRRWEKKPPSGLCRVSRGNWMRKTATILNFRADWRRRTILTASMRTANQKKPKKRPGRATIKPMKNTMGRSIPIFRWFRKAKRYRKTLLYRRSMCRWETRGLRCMRMKESREAVRKRIPMWFVLRNSGLRLWVLKEINIMEIVSMV